MKHTVGLNQIHRTLGTFLALAAAGFFIATAIRNLDSIPAVNWCGASVMISFFSVGLAMLVVAVSACVWALLLRDVGVSVSWRRTQSILAIAQFGKYLPGSVAQHVGRVFLGREAGIPAAVTIGTMLIETVWLIGVAATLGLIALLQFVDASSLGVLAAAQPVGIFLLIALTLIMPWAAISVVNSRLPRLARRLSPCGRIPMPGLRTALAVGTLFVACFFLAGSILKLHAEWFFEVSGVSLVELTCLFAIAWVAGYLTPGAPGGLGVREALMVLLLSPVVGSGVAVGLGVTLRIATTLGDLLSLLVGIAMRHRLNGSVPARNAR